HVMPAHSASPSSPALLCLPLPSTTPYISCPRCMFFFFFNDPATPEIYTLSLHDALPICRLRDLEQARRQQDHARSPARRVHQGRDRHAGPAALAGSRSEEHTSELQSLTNIVCRLLLEKKKRHTMANNIYTHIDMSRSHTLLHPSTAHAQPSFTPLSCFFFFLMTPPPPRSTLFPYTTLFRSVVSAISSKHAGSKITLGLQRGGSTKDVTVTLAQQPSQAPDRKSTRLNSSH